MTIWLQITSGRGPEECCQAVTLVLGEIRKEAGRAGIRVDLLEAVSSDTPGGLRSALLSLEGDSIREFAASWEGPVLWIAQSRFRPHHKRKNWYAGVSALSMPEAVSWSEKDLKYERMRASGPGGQHVNKTESAVRITHLPTGTSVTAQEERSQHMNRKLAEVRLAKRLEAIAQQEQKDCEQSRWQQHNILERGNPVRVYEGEKFRRKS